MSQGVLSLIWTRRLKQGVLMLLLGLLLELQVLPLLWLLLLVGCLAYCQHQSLQTSASFLLVSISTESEIPLRGQPSRVLHVKRNSSLLYNMKAELANRPALESQTLDYNRN